MQQLRAGGVFCLVLISLLPSGAVLSYGKRRGQQKFRVVTSVNSVTEGGFGDLIKT